MANPYWMPWLPIEIWLLCKIIILEGVGEDLPSLYYDNYLLAHRARSFVNNYFLFCLSDDAFFISFQRVSFKTTGLHEWRIAYKKTIHKNVYLILVSPSFISTYFDLATGISFYILTFWCLT